MGDMKAEHLEPYERSFWAKNRINLLRSLVNRINISEKAITLEDGKTMPYDKLVLALGSEPNSIGLKGERLKGVGTMYSYQDLEYLEKYSKRIKYATIVGGGLIGIELAEMLWRRGKKVSMWVREDHFWGNVLHEAESRIIEEEIKAHGIALKLGTELKTIIGQEKVEQIISSKDEEIACDYLGISIGVHPNIGFIKTKNKDIETNRGILVDAYLETSVKDIYAIGDCAELRKSLEKRRPIEAIWYTGVFQGEYLAENIFEKKTPYKPKNWFNSAKFFSIEYQVYGDVPRHLPDNYGTYYWENTKEKKCIRFVYEKEHNLFFRCTHTRYAFAT